MTEVEEGTKTEEPGTGVVMYAYKRSDGYT